MMMKNYPWSRKLMQNLEDKLKHLNPIFPGLVKAATPYLESGRSFDLQHTFDALEILLDFLEINRELDPDILIPAMIFHDSGWSQVPKNILSASYGDVSATNQGKLLHQAKGAEIARKVLEKHSYDPEKTAEVSFIVSIHDKPTEYRKHHNALVVAEIDKLVRYLPYLFWILIEEGTQTFEERLQFLENGLNSWFSIPEFKDRASSLLEQRKMSTRLYTLFSRKVKLLSALPLKVKGRCGR